MLTLYIHFKPKLIARPDGFSRIYPIAFLRRNKRRWVHMDYKRKNEQFRSVKRIRLIFAHPRRSRYIPISSRLNQAIVTSLNKYHVVRVVSFDCYAFATLAAGLPLHNVKDLLKYWKVSIHIPPSLPRGEVVFLLGDKEGIHAAVYLGSGLYLALCGAGGIVSVCTLQDMKKEYGKIGLNNLIWARPRR